MEHAEHDAFRPRLLKKSLARDRAEKAKCRMKNKNDSMHRDTSVPDAVSDVSVVSNMTYSEHNSATEQNSDECEVKDDKKEKKEMKTVVLVKTSEESDTTSMVHSVGPMWSERPSATDSERTSTQTTPTTACSTETGYTTKGSKGKKLQNKKLENKRDYNKKKQRLKKKMIHRKFGVQFNVEADEGDGTGNSDGESCL